MKKLVLIMMSLSLLAGCKPPQKGSTDTSVPVTVYNIKPENISTYIKLTGGIEAEEDAIVYSKVSEKLDNIMVKLGETVQTDQILALQYNKSLKESVNQATASLSNAQSQYDMTKTDFERMERLNKNKAISQQQFDQSKAQFKAAKSTLDQAKATLKLMQEQYENSLIKAPFSGKVAIIYYDKDQMVQSGQPVFKIVNAKNIKAKLALPEVDISRVAVGQRVFVTFPALADTQFTGVVYRVDEAIDPDTRTLEIKVRMDNPNGMLKSGQFGQFMIEIQRHEQTLVITDNAVMTQTEVEVTDEGEQKEIKRYYIYLVKNGKAEKQFVKPGLYSKGRMELIEGTSAGDSLIVMGQNIVKDGNPVRVVNK